SPGTPASAWSSTWLPETPGPPAAVRPRPSGDGRARPDVLERPRSPGPSESVGVAVGQPGGRGVDAEIADPLGQGVHHGPDRCALLAAEPHQRPCPVDLRADQGAPYQVGRQGSGLALRGVDHGTAAAAHMVEEGGTGDAAVGDGDGPGTCVL